MLNFENTDQQVKEGRNLKREKKHWHDEQKNSLSLGCIKCFDRNSCGGLRVKRSLYDCYDYCCNDSARCDLVCRNNPKKFAAAVREVGGLNLSNVPRAPQLSAPALPLAVPVLYNGYCRRSRFEASFVCLPLSTLVSRQRGRLRYIDAKSVAEGFKFKPEVPFILTGTDCDKPLERFWALGAHSRIDMIRMLRDLGVSLVTVPNFSLLTDVPRLDNVHNIKRIAKTHEEFLREGIPAALHVNARTDYDWEMWGKYISAREEITHITFEFATGSGHAGRKEWHVAQLVKLAQYVGRSIHLVVRAADENALSALREAFASMTVLDTNSFMRAVYRWKAVEKDSGNLVWRRSLTNQREPIDDLLNHNWSVVNRRLMRMFEKRALLNVAE